MRLRIGRFHIIETWGTPMRLQRIRRAFRPMRLRRIRPSSGPIACGNTAQMRANRTSTHRESDIGTHRSSIAGRWRRNDHYANVPRCMLTCTSIWACRDNYTRHTGVHTPEKKNAGKCIFLATIASKKTIYYRHRTVSLSCRRPGWAAESIFCRSRSSRTRSGAKETAM